MNQVSRSMLALMATLSLAACTPKAPQVLGTLEWDRITMPAPVSERIAEVAAHEGQMVAANDTVLTLESVRTRARLDAATADVQRFQKALDELRVGPRQEDIDQARAKLAGAQSVAINAHRALERAQAELAKQVIAHSDFDSLKAQAGSADADVDAAKAALATLLNGTRPQDIAQAEASVASAQAQVDSITVDLQRVRISAPRAGRIDSIPYKLGDQPPIGAPLVIELVGDAPYARVYVPETLRASVHVGDAARIYLEDGKTSVAGRVRLVRSEPSFTPYYALNGDDVSRMTYIAEIELGKDAASLPAGLPVRAQFSGAAK
jgi:HlyD family secretion protein